jgi:hypothetical protein
MSDGAVRWRSPRGMRVAGIFLLACVLAGCAPAATGARAGPTSSTASGVCAPTDQDRYVYDPGRLQVVQACLRVTGTVDRVIVSTDGDSIILLRLDPPYQHLLTPGNFEGEDGGDLGIEAVCTIPPVEAIVIGLCAGDPDPAVGPYPPVGAHVWVEGRYIYDLHHESHAELHPLYRIGALAA